MSEVSEMLQRIRELSEQSAVEIQKQDPDYSGLNYSRDPGYGAIPSLTSLDLGDIFKTDHSNVQPFTWNSLTPSSVGTITAGTGLNYNSPYTISNNTASATWTSMPFSNGSTGTSSQIDLKGPEADIRINGVSVVDMLTTIQDRLNVLVPNPELEAEWDQLRELGEQYRKLEKKVKEQGDMWARLKAMPPPEID
jgi:hypothetical protein